MSPDNRKRPKAPSPDDEDRKGQVVYRTPKPGGDQADKSQGKGDDAINQSAESGRDLSQSDVGEKKYSSE
jgi:hypothetical protein